MGNFRNFISSRAWEVASVECGRGTAEMAKRRKRVVLSRSGRQNYGHARDNRCQFRRGNPGCTVPGEPSRNDSNVGTVRLRRKQRRSEILDQHAAEGGIDTNVGSDELDCQPEQIDRALEPQNNGTQLLKSGAAVEKLTL